MTDAAKTYPQILSRSWVSICVPDAIDASGGRTRRIRQDTCRRCLRSLWPTMRLVWLYDLPPHTAGMAAREDSYATTPLDADNVRGLMATAVMSSEQMPADLRALIADPVLQRRPFCATDAYFDAGQRMGPVPGGHLLHRSWIRNGCVTGWLTWAPTADPEWSARARDSATTLSPMDPRRTRTNRRRP